jgi:hypothetical protein
MDTRPIHKVWDEWLRWLHQVETTRQELRRLAPPLSLSDLAHLEAIPCESYTMATEKYRHLVERGKSLLAEYLNAQE